jgi:hypothetical protein
LSVQPEAHDDKDKDRNRGGTGLVYDAISVRNVLEPWLLLERFRGRSLRL